jgi:hypothetical protein
MGCIGGTAVKTFEFAYRGNEILVSVHAHTEEEAREYLRTGAPGAIWNETVNYRALWPEFWELMEEDEEDMS